MEVLVELVPKKLSKFVEILREVSNYADGVDIPDSPLGKPSPSSPVVSGAIKALYPNLKVIAHIRLADINELALLAQIKALTMLGVDGVVVTRGDQPAVGSSTSNISSEQALRIVRENLRSSVKLGAVLSLRYPREDILSRLRAGFDFFLVTRLSHESFEKFLDICETARHYGTKLYPYVIIATDKNVDIMKILSQPYVKADEVPRFVDRLRGVVDGVVLSCPRDYETLLNLLKSITA
ncbi:MAG: hypothetical protein DRO12_02655 [Thermoprotei archaeon]|nr:MAG: hypothetical protein DRO12_02655 [Thermoprotei archaeon]